MNCEEAREWFGLYQDLPEDSAERISLDLHVHSCVVCMEEFKLWEESAQLIHELPAEADYGEETESSVWMNRSVMDRIYAEQSWYMPAMRRTYAFTYTFRRKVAVVLAALLALFVCGFVYTAFDQLGSSGANRSAMMESATQFAINHRSTGSIQLEVPVASLSDPIMLNVTPAMPEYWIILSIVGMIMTMMILNWFSRVRS